MITQKEECHNHKWTIWTKLPDQRMISYCDHCNLEYEVLVCKDCYNDNHIHHMKNLKLVRDDVRLKRHLHVIDGIDCKNELDRFNQCICPEFIMEKQRLMKELWW